MQTRRDTVEYGLRRWIIVIGVVLAPLMETIDSSIVNVALPTLEGNLGATLDQATWIITGYLTANVIVIPLTPWLQTRFGRRQYFTATIIGFTVASMLCAFSTSINELIFFRILQGCLGMDRSRPHSLRYAICSHSKRSASAKGSSRSSFWSVPP